ncbi:MAG TPA: glycosyltransferase, partial [Stellaceae bacterium]|nr:glycosyltransferase [Stellaceae bacterium]
MKILIVSWYFPPVNTIGALRVGKFARFLIEHGHDVGVVAGKHWGHPETLPLGVPLERVAYAKWLDINAMPPRMGRPAQPAARQAGETASPASNEGGTTAPSRLKIVKRRLRTAYYDLTNVPDNRIGWLPWASAAGRALCRSWTPDLIFGSGPPFTALLACRTLSARLNIPWVAELRDRWADDPYDVVPRWRAALNQWLERRTLGSAAGLVTVTEPWAEFYRRKYD